MGSLSTRAAKNFSEKTTLKSGVIDIKKLSYAECNSVFRQIPFEGSVLKSSFSAQRLIWHASKSLVSEIPVTQHLPLYELRTLDLKKD